MDDHDIRRLSVAKIISTCAEGVVREKSSPLIETVLVKKFNRNEHKTKTAGMGPWLSACQVMTIHVTIRSIHDLLMLNDSTRQFGRHADANTDGFVADPCQSAG
jgi:hypothetical protein